MTQSEQREIRLKRNGQSLKDLNICVFGDPEEEKKDSRAEKVLEEITSESFPNLVTDINRRVKVSIFKQGKSKEIHAKLHHSQTSENSRKKKMKAERGKHHLTYRGKTIKMTGDFSS